MSKLIEITPEVESWRLHVLIEAGYPLPLAERLAGSQADLHTAVDLVSGVHDEVIDRDEETHKLLQWAVGGHFVRLVALRKYGKTSLLGRVLRDGERSEGLIPILVDLY